jgi:iron-sulfur cluster assembly protein
VVLLARLKEVDFSPFALSLSKGRPFFSQGKGQGFDKLSPNGIGSGRRTMNAPTTTTRARPAAVTLTANAEKRVADLMAKAPEGAVGVKLSTPKRGCSGLAYSVDFVTEAGKFDEKIETPGGTFFIDAASVLYLIGSTMDWVEDDFAAGFVFNNPNAKGSCGCGESFTV